MNAILDILFPQSCIICAKKGSYICNRCKKLFKKSLPECYKCRKISPFYATHQECKTDFSLDSVFVLWKYDILYSPILKKYKYSSIYDLEKTIISLIAESIKILPCGLEESLVIPVPISRSRMRDRGFNQSSVIAKTISEYINGYYREDIVSRKNYDSTHQALLDRDNRLKSENFFYPTNREVLKNYKKFLIVDDVITTGTTLENMCKTIKQENPGCTISALCLFRGSPPKQKYLN